MTTEADPRADTSIGPPASEETVIVEPNPHADDETLLAWSTEVFDYPATPKPWRTALLAGAAIISTGAAIALGIATFTTNQQTTSSTSTTIYAAPPPSAVPPTAEPEPKNTIGPAPRSFSGRYTMTDSNPDTGQTFTQMWFVTPCGDGCVHIEGKDTDDHARLIDGFWTWDAPHVTCVCADGSEISDAGSSHTAIDATTLRGTAHLTWDRSCAGTSTDPNINNIVLTRAD